MSIHTDEEQRVKRVGSRFRPAERVCGTTPKPVVCPDFVDHSKNNSKKGALRRDDPQARPCERKNGRRLLPLKPTSVSANGLLAEMGVFPPQTTSPKEER